MLGKRKDAKQDYRARNTKGGLVVANANLALPNVFVVGSAKAGTTALYHYFKLHPQVFVPEVKEANYMAFHAESPNFCGPGDREVHAKCTVTTFKAYAALYQKRSNEPVCADVSPSYLTFPRAAFRIRELCPSAKIIIVLRSPIECAFSMYSMLRRDRREPCRSFRKAFYLSGQRLAAGWGKAWDYQNGYMLSHQVPQYLSIFPKSQLFIRRYELFRDRPERFYRELCQFLRIGEIDLVDANRPMNVGCTKRDLIRSRKMGRWMLRTAQVAGMLLPSAVKAPLRNQFLAKRAFEISAEDRKMLVDHYRSDILRISAILSWDLSDWLEMGC